MPRGPYEWRGSLKEPGRRLPLWDPSSALRWLPAAVYPATAGPPGHGAGEGTKIRAAGSSAWPASVPTHVAARRTGAARVCPVVPPRGREPGATASASPSPALRVRVCVQGGRHEGIGAHKGRGADGRGRGVSPAPNCSPNEMQARFATPTQRTLGNAKRHWQIQGKQAEFLLATK